MAERRMFAKTIIDSDAFLDMPTSSQLLYFHLSMRADDDGFVNKPKSIMRMIGAKDDDLKLLFVKKFLIPFDSGVVVIKHWKIHNYIRKDTYTETKYKEEKATLELDENSAYRIATTEPLQIRDECVTSTSTQVRIGKDRIGKDRLGEESIEDTDSKTNRKASKNTIYFPLDEQLNSTFLDFIKMRKKIKAPMTERAITLMVNKIDRLAGTDSVLAIDILEQSIMNGWKDVYPLKDGKNNSRSSGQIDWSKV